MQEVKMITKKAAPSLVNLPDDQAALVREWLKTQEQYEKLEAEFQEKVKDIVPKLGPMKQQVMDILFQVRHQRSVVDNLILQWTGTPEKKNVSYASVVGEALKRINEEDQKIVNELLTTFTKLSRVDRVTIEELPAIAAAAPEKNVIPFPTQLPAAPAVAPDAGTVKAESIRDLAKRLWDYLSDAFSRTTSMLLKQKSNIEDLKKAINGDVENDHFATAESILDGAIQLESLVAEKKNYSVLLKKSGKEELRRVSADTAELARKEVEKSGSVTVVKVTED